MIPNISWPMLETMQNLAVGSPSPRTKDATWRALKRRGLVDSFNLLTESGLRLLCGRSPFAVALVLSAERRRAEYYVRGFAGIYVRINQPFWRDGWVEPTISWNIGGRDGCCSDTLAAANFGAAIVDAAERSRAWQMDV